MLNKMNEEEKYSIDEIKHLLFQELVAALYNDGRLYGVVDVLGENNYIFLEAHPIVERYLNELYRRGVPPEHIQQLVRRALSMGLVDEHTEKRGVLYLRSYIILLALRKYHIEARNSIDHDLDIYARLIPLLDASIGKLPTDVNLNTVIKNYTHMGETPIFVESYLGIPSVSSVDPAILLMIQFLLLNFQIAKYTPPEIIDQFGENDIQSSVLKYNAQEILRLLSASMDMTPQELYLIFLDFLNGIPPRFTKQHKEDLRV